jgi:hypothetical protein
MEWLKDWDDVVIKGKKKEKTKSNFYNKGAAAAGGF